MKNNRPSKQTILIPLDSTVRIYIALTFPFVIFRFIISIFNTINIIANDYFFFSEYPDQRHRVDQHGAAVGVPGTLKRLQRMVISSQPINALDWNRDHLGLAVATAYDQCIRIIITTKLNLQ